MKQNKTLANLAFFFALAAISQSVLSQGTPTASQRLELSAFGGATGTFTDIFGGKNVGITAGVDLTYLPLRFIRPSIEFRGTYPIDKGTIDSQKNFLAGVKVEHPLGRFHPYADFLIGRGEVDYNNGLIVGFFDYLSSTSTIYSPGGGLDYNLTDRLALKGDVQYQHWDVPVIASGTIHPVAVTFGGVYRFNFNSRHHR